MTVTVTMVEIQRAEAFGRIAARGGLGAGACPYQANGSAAERLLAARFVAAYLDADGPVSVDYDDGTRTHVTDKGTTIHVSHRSPVE